MAWPPALGQIESAVAELPPQDQQSLLTWLQCRLPAAPSPRQLQKEVSLTAAGATMWKQAVTDARRYLHSFLRDEMMVIGFTFKHGIPGFKVEGESPLAALDPDSLDGQLARVGVPLFLVDLRTAAKAGPVADWLKKAMKTRMSDRYVELKPLDAFDALLFVETVSAAYEIQPLRSSLK